MPTNLWTVLLPWLQSSGLFSVMGFDRIWGPEIYWDQLWSLGGAKIANLGKFSFSHYSFNYERLFAMLTEDAGLNWLWYGIFFSARYTFRLLDASATHCQQRCAIKNSDFFFVPQNASHLALTTDYSYIYLPSNLKQLLFFFFLLLFVFPFLHSHISLPFLQKIICFPF